MARQEINNPLEFSEHDRPKIQDIIPRKNQRDSLLAKIMGPRIPSALTAPAGRSVAPAPEQNAAGGFFRSLSFRRGQNKKPEKVIRLKKSALPERVFVSVDNVRSKEKRIPVSVSKRVLEKPLLPVTIREIEAKAEKFAALQPDSSRQFRFSFRVSFLFGIFCAVGIVILLSTVFARATISLEPSVVVLSLDGIRIEAGTVVAEIDGVGKKIPAFLVEIAASLKREFSPSAKERVSRKATGTVRIYNIFSSAPQTLVARTRFQDKAGRTFFLKQRVTVPGAAAQNGKLAPRFISASVEAERAGGEFNIAPTRFTIPGFAGSPKFSGFYAESSEPFAGGVEGEALVARQSDIDAASEEVTAALFAQLKEELEKKIPSGVTAIQGAREITVTAVRKPKAGEAGEHFFVEASGKAAVMVFRMDDLFSLLGQLALSSDAEKIISPEKSRLEFDTASLSLKNRTLSFEVRGTVAAVFVLAPDEFQRAVSDKTRSNVENILRADSRIRAFGIGIFPPWRMTVPADGEKIRILVRE